MRGEAWRASLCIWLPRGVRRDHGHGNMRLKAGNALSPEVCAVTMFPSAVDFYSHANSLLFDMLSDRQSSTFWASGSVMAGAEARGTRLVPSGCSVAGLARRTCDTRARPRGCARRGFSPNMSDRLPRLLWASPCGRALAGRWWTIPAAARGCPGRSRAGGGASRRSNRSSETARVLSESQSRRCRSFADGSPHVRAMRSPSDLARGGARAVVGALD